MKSRTRKRGLGSGLFARLWMNLAPMALKKLGKDQRGFTILELVIVMLLTGLITTAVTTTFFQVFEMNTRTANHMTAVSQVQQAGKLVSDDILEAQTVTAGDSQGFPLSLNWTDSQTDEEHEVIYTLADGGLWRSESIGDGDSTMTRVAEHIDAEETSFYPLGVLPAGGTLTFTVTATVGDESETRVYEVKPRPGSS